MMDGIDLCIPCQPFSSNNLDVLALMFNRFQPHEFQQFPSHVPSPFRGDHVQKSSVNPTPLTASFTSKDCISGVPYCISLGLAQFKTRLRSEHRIM